MVERDTIFEGKVRQIDIFDFKEMYNFLYKWLVDESYKVDEKVYSEKVTPVGKEVDIEWEAKKKISDYFRFVLKPKWKILGMTTVEVDKGGKKVTMNKGQVEIKVAAVLEKDYEARWETSGFLKFLRGVYDKYIIRARIEGYERKLFGEADEFLAQMKAFLALEGAHGKHPLI